MSRPGLGPGPVTSPTPKEATVSWAVATSRARTSGRLTLAIRGTRGSLVGSRLELPAFQRPQPRILRSLEALRTVHQTGHLLPRGLLAHDSDADRMAMAGDRLVLCFCICSSDPKPHLLF